LESGERPAFIKENIGRAMTENKKTEALRAVDSIGANFHVVARSRPSVAELRAMGKR
jgi:hypothetical protein